MAKSKKASGESKILAQNLNDVERVKLGKLMNSGVVQLTHIDDLKASYNESVTMVAEELGLDVKSVKKAISTLYKQNFFEQTEAQEEVEAILTVSGNLSIKE